MTIELKEAIETAKLNLRAALKGVSDPIKTVSLLNRVATLARISPTETFATGREVWYNIIDYVRYAEDHGRNGLADNLRGIANDFYTVLQGWYGPAKDIEDFSRKGWDRGDVDKVCIGRWESKGGKHWVELHHGRYDYSYCSSNSGGSIGDPNMPNLSAVTIIEAMLARGCFLPDNAVLPMKRVN